MDRAARKAARAVGSQQAVAPDTSPDWARKCENCGQVPTVGNSRLCGPCYFGEADTANGNW